jgi:hypothetical protein
MHEEHSDHHDHNHGHTGGGPQIRTLLEYMIEHNKSHAAELDELARKLRGTEQQAAADLIAEGITDFDRGNKKLVRALELLPAGDP